MQEVPVNVFWDIEVSMGAGHGLCRGGLALLFIDWSYYVIHIPFNVITDTPIRRVLLSLMGLTFRALSACALFLATIYCFCNISQKNALLDCILFTDGQQLCRNLRIVSHSP